MWVFLACLVQAHQIQVLALRPVVIYSSQHPLHSQPIGSLVFHLHRRYTQVLHSSTHTSVVDLGLIRNSRNIDTALIGPL